MPSHPFLLLTTAHLSDHQLHIDQRVVPAPPADFDRIDQLAATSRLVASARFVAVPMTDDQRRAWQTDHETGRTWTLDARRVRARMAGDGVNPPATLIRAALESYPELDVYPRNLQLDARLAAIRASAMRTDRSRQRSPASSRFRDIQPADVGPWHRLADAFAAHRNRYPEENRDFHVVDASRLDDVARRFVYAPGPRPRG